MIDIQKQIDYWRHGAAEERDVALYLLRENRLRHALFLLHLSIEKILKAHVCKKNGDLPPKSHNLLRLADATGMVYTQHDRDFLGELSLFNIEGRYPELYEELPPASEVQRIALETERIYQWLLNQL